LFHKGYQSFGTAKFEITNV